MSDAKVEALIDEADINHDGVNSYSSISIFIKELKCIFEISIV